MLQELSTQALKVGPWLLANKELVFSILGGATGLVITTQTIVHKSQTLLNKVSPVKRKVTSFVLAQTLTGIAAIATYLVTNVDLKEFYPWLAAIVTAVHQLAINPIYTTKILPFLQFQAEQKENAALESAQPYGGYPEPVNTPQAAGIFVSQ